jgi:hypothetical protein
MRIHRSYSSNNEMFPLLVDTYDELRLLKNALFFRVTKHCKNTNQRIELTFIIREKYFEFQDSSSSAAAAAAVTVGFTLKLEIRFHHHCQKFSLSKSTLSAASITATNTAKSTTTNTRKTTTEYYNKIYY